MDSDWRQVALYAILGFLVATGGIAGAAHISNTFTVTGQSTLQSNDGLVVTVTGDPVQNFEDPWTLGGTVNIVTESGNATFYSPGAASVTVAKSEIEGTWTNVSNVDADPNSIQIDPDDKSQVTIAQEIESFSYTGSYAVDDNTVDFVYAGTTGVSEVTITGVPASTYIGAVDRDTGALLDSAQSDGSGSITFDALTNSEHAVVLQTGTAPTITDPSPTGDLSNPPTQLSVQVNDTDFPGDDVEVEFSLDGSVVGTKTTSTNGTVTQSIAAPDGGDHTWSVDVADGYGNTVNKSYSFRVPTNLTFREESPSHTLIDSAALPAGGSVDATCYEDVETNPEIIDRSTTNGEIDLTGFPTGTEFSCQVSAEGYHNRTILLESLYEQDTAFLISKSGPTTVENRFVVNDRTGDFPAENTEIIVEASINQSLYATGGYAWLSAAGDDLGADEAFVTDLIEEDRYRIVVRNDDGDTRVLGAYTAETTGTIELNIGNISVDPDKSGGVDLNATWYNTSAGVETVKVEYNDSEDATDTLYLKVYEQNNESNTLIANQSFTSGPYGTFSYTQTVPAGEEDTTWVVEVVGDRSTNTDGEAVENVRFKRYVGPNVTVLTAMPQWLVTVLFVGMIWGVAGLFSQVNGHVGGIVTAGLGGMLYFVGLTPGYLGIGVVALSLLTAGILFVRESRAGAI